MLDASYFYIFSRSNILWIIMIFQSYTLDYHAILEF